MEKFKAFQKKLGKTQVLFMDQSSINDSTPDVTLLKDLHFNPERKDYPIDIIQPVPLEKLGDCIWHCLKQDPARSDGLIATVVVDEHGVALGLVYSNQESVNACCVDQRGVYWSRSRKSLWKKGESSGAIQELVSIKSDCDHDALRISVIQKGIPPSFCHKNIRTCWYLLLHTYPKLVIIF